MNTAIKKIRTHYVIISHGEKGEDKIPITFEQFRNIERNKQALPATTLLKIQDADSDELLFYRELRRIVGFEERKKSTIEWEKYFCDFGHSHLVGADCDCKSKYITSPGTFRGIARELFPNLHYIQDITEHERDTVIATLKKCQQ